MLRRLRLDAGLSQEALAERARMSVDAISALERGTRRSPQRQTLALLIDALRLDGALRDEFRAAAARTPPARAAVASSPPRPTLKRNHNLPYPLTSFVGRSAERAMLAERLASERLVSLVGTGGVGKTRLAVELGHLVLDRFPDGVWLIELAEIRDPALIVAAMCRPLGVREEPHVPLIETLLAALEASAHLLIVDNCEHLVASVAPLVATLLARAPHVRVVITSREPLRILGENLHRVAPLDVDGTAANEAAAVRLFADRARAVDAGFRLDESSLASVRTIVRRLDGLPLAIELAAARAGEVSVKTIADRLERRLGMLHPRTRTALPHHVTVHALVDWSYQQLEPLEQLLFRRLGVFAGGCTFEAIETIVADRGLEHADLFDVLLRLADKSMIVAEPEREHFRLLETMREYAWERLEEAGESARYVEQHAAYYLDLAERHGNVLRGPLQGDAFAALTAELGNIRSALSAAAGRLDDDDRALRGLAAMMDYWQLAGSNTECRSWVDAIERLGLKPSITLARIYFTATHIAISESTFDDVRRFAAAAAAACADTQDPVLELNLAAADLLAEVLGNASVAVDRVVALRRRAETVDDPTLLETVATAQAFDALARGDADAAAAFFEEALRCSQRSGDPLAIAGASLVLARFVLMETDAPRAARLLIDAIPLLAQREQLSTLASALDGLVLVAARLGEHASAARFLGAARRMHRVSGASTVSLKAPPVPPRLIDELREVLGDDAYGEQLGEGERAFVTDVVESVRAFGLTVR